MKTQHKTVAEIYGPIVVVTKVPDAKYQEMVEIELPDGSRRRGRVLEADEDRALVPMFEGTRGLELTGPSAPLLGRPLQVGLSGDMVGRVFKGDGAPRDQKPAIIPETTRDINGAPINPFSRDYPDDFIQTGISSIDVLTPLVRGQKLPIFSGAGLPHSKLAAQIARQARMLTPAEVKKFNPNSNVAELEGEKFAVVFAAMGVTYEEAQYFRQEFERTGAISRAVLFVNTADNPVVERIATPRLALTAAEYLAFEKGYHVTVILTDMTNYCEALREVYAARKEVPGRRGYPGYLYTDLANIYERAGRIRGRKGSVTQIPILTMPEDDVTHPVPDLTGYITEGQIRQDRALHQKGIYPPVIPMGSLSRLKGKAQGEGKTREDHSGMDAQLSASYARGVEIRELAVILGESSLSDTDKAYLRFADRFEKEFLTQSDNEERSIYLSLEIGWDLLTELPRSELKRVKGAHADTYLQKK